MSANMQSTARIVRWPEGYAAATRHADSCR